MCFLENFVELMLPSISMENKRKLCEFNCPHVSEKPFGMLPARSEAIDTRVNGRIPTFNSLLSENNCTNLPPTALIVFTLVYFILFYFILPLVEYVLYS